MANPQPNEFTKISNELLDALCRTRISGEARQILDVILRKTYGFNKKEDAISLSQFSKITGMPRPTCSRAVKKLESMEIITTNHEKYIVKYSIQKDYECWKVLSKKITDKKGVSVIKNDNQVLSKKTMGVIKNDNKTVIKKDTHKRKKETIQKKGLKKDERIHRINKYIMTLETVSKLRKQPTFEECEKLEKVYESNDIRSYLDDMENWKPLLKTKSVVHTTLVRWLNRDNKKKVSQ